MRTFLISLGGLIVALISAVYGGNLGIALAVVATFVSAWAQYRQYKESQPYELVIVRETWERLGRLSLRIVVGSNIHMKGKAPIPSYYMKQPDGSYIAVVESFLISQEGEVTLESAQPFEGKLIIK